MWCVKVMSIIEGGIMFMVYKCRFCEFTHKDDHVMVKHKEELCERRPSLKNCFSCKFKGTNGYGQHGCYGSYWVGQGDAPCSAWEEEE